MHKSLILATILCATAGSSARAQVDLSTYADANGFINVQTLSCAQLAGTWQGDADMLTTWYSGWYTDLPASIIWMSGKAKKRSMRSLSIARPIQIS
jgi:hypothetical protein